MAGRREQENSNLDRAEGAILVNPEVTFDL